MDDAQSTPRKRCPSQGTAYLQLCWRCHWAAGAGLGSLPGFCPISRLQTRSAIMRGWLMHQGSAICRLIILLMMLRGLDLGLAANVSAGQPVTQLLLLFFLIILIFVSPLTSLCWTSHAFICLKVFLSAPSIQVHFSTLSFVVCLSFFLFHVLQIWVSFLLLYSGRG